MSKHEIDTHENIMTAAIQLIEEHGDAARITMRDIAAKANVGVGLINYHFQTKDNLISQCVQRMIGLVIDKFEPLYKSLEMKPLDKLKYLVKLNSGFLVTNIGISRISISNDILSGNSNDNSTQTAKAYFPVVKEVCGDKKTESEIYVMLHILISSLQVAFLRSEVLKETNGIDFFNVEQRELFIDRVIDSIFCGIC